MTYRKVGGLHWLFIGRMRIAFCRVKRLRIPADQMPRQLSGPIKPWQHSGPVLVSLQATPCSGSSTLPDATRGKAMVRLVSCLPGRDDPQWQPLSI